MRRRFWIPMLILAVLTACAGSRLWAEELKVPPIPEGPYTTDWDSLSKVNEAPDWFRDAKFGIYFHWGVYSVPAFGSEWYPRNMHIKTRPEYKHHVETYGDPTEFEYADFVPMFKAENFDADEWAELFKKAGARFAGPVAEHHDGFSMWASKVTPWNAKDKGPKRDIVGELEKAIRARGMKFVATFHHARNNLWEKSPGQWTGHYEYIKKDFPSLLEDPENAILYGYMPREQFLKMWLIKLTEVIDNYQPDLIWFDSWLDEIPEDYRKAFLAYYFNRAHQWGREVVVTFKQRDLPRTTALEDFEKGRLDHLTEYCWLTDDTISKGSWCYTQDLQIKDTQEVLQVLIDIVSKNGCLLLNISPKADGTIPDNQKQVLLGLGEWLKVNGEAIYETRPWLVYGEGPTKMAKGGAFVGSVRYTGRDVRYTTRGNTLYAIALDWPDASPLVLQSVEVDEVPADAKVELLGYDKPIAFEVTADKKLALAIPELSPEQRPCKYAYAFKISGFKYRLHPDAMVSAVGATEVTADKAKLEGRSIRLEQRGGLPNIGYWDDPQDKAYWIVNFPVAGKYQVRVTTASMESSKLTVEVANSQVTGTVQGRRSFDDARTYDLGVVEIPKPGQYKVTVRPADPATWKPVNLWEVIFVPRD
ncbi:hypothetical protein JCM19992_26770 [Thermostilla marina]